MARLYNLARVSTATLGIGSVVLGAAVPGYITWADSGVQNGDVVSYAIHDFVAGALVASEVGRGTYTTATNSLSRDTVLDSTNGGAKIALNGNAQVVITLLAEDMDHTSGSILNVGVFTHTQIDSHITNVANPHATTAAQVGAQPVDATLTSIAALGTAADKMIYTTAVDTWAETGLSAFARTFLDDANAAAVRTTIGAQAELGFTPVDIASANYVDLTDSGTTTLHSHSVSGSAIVTVDTLANIMLLSPTAGKIAYATTVSATDTRTVNKFYVADGTNWREIELPMSSRTSVDMGLEADSGQNGYGTDYITDKTLHSVAIKGHPKTPVNGSVRMNIDSTPDTFEVYMRDTAWFTILYDMTTASGDLRHTPLSEAIYVWRGDSVQVGPNGRNIVQEYSVSMGANPPPRVLYGGTF